MKGVDFTLEGGAMLLLNVEELIYLWNKKILFQL